MIPYSSSDDLISPLNIIFSCVVCQRTIGDIYPEATSINHGNDNRNTDATQCMLWMTECSHIACNDHFEGMVVHSAGSRPTALCPLCFVEKGDEVPKKLYNISGPGFNEHDSNIPASWFNTPPMRLNDSTPEISALRFQYLSLVRYGVMLHNRFNKLKSSFNSVKTEKSRLGQDLRISELDCLRLRARVEDLEIFQEKYNSWKQREPEITHYLDSFSNLVKENSQLKGQLRDLEYVVAQPSKMNCAQPSHRKDNHRPSDTLNSSYSRISGRSIQGACHERIAPTVVMSSSPPPSIGQTSRKRQRENDMEDINPYESLHNKPPTSTRISSSKLMPPPRLPANRPSRSSNDVKGRTRNPYNPHQNLMISEDHSPETQILVPFAPVPSLRRGSQLQSHSRLPSESRLFHEHPESVVNATPWKTGVEIQHSDMPTPARNSRLIPSQTSQARDTSNYYVSALSSVIDMPSKAPFNTSNASITPSRYPQNSIRMYDDTNYGTPHTHNSRKHISLSHESSQNLNQGTVFWPIQTPMRTTRSIVETQLKNEFTRGRRMNNFTLNSLSFMNTPYTSMNKPIKTASHVGILNPTQLQFGDNTRPVTQKSWAPNSQTLRTSRLGPSGAIPNGSSSSGHNHTSHLANIPQRQSQRIIRGQESWPPSRSGPLRHGMRSSMSVTTSTGRGRLKR